MYVLVARMVMIVPRRVRGLARIVRIETRMVKHYQDGQNSKYDCLESHNFHNDGQNIYQDSQDRHQDSHKDN